MVDPFSALQSLAEIGIAITGFAGLVAAIGHRRDEPLSLLERSNLRALLLWSLGATFLAYVPVVLAIHTSDEPWRASLAVFAAFHSFVYYEVFRGRRDARRRREGDVALTTFSRFLIVFGFVVLGFEVAAAAGAFASSAATVYVVAVLWFLFLAVTRFATLVAGHLRVDGEEEAG